MRGGDLSPEIFIEEDGEPRRIDAGEVSISLGGPEADITTAGEPGAQPSAFIGSDGGDLFIQPADGATGVLCNGDPLAASQWLRDGDIVALADTRVAVSIDSTQARFRVDRGEVTRISTPLLTPPPRDAGPAESPALDPPEHVMIAPAAFTPSTFDGAGKRRRASRPAMLLTWLGLAALAFAAWFTFSARTVEFRFDPEPDHVEVQGPWLKLELGGRHLLRPGTYTLVAEKEGYRRLETDLEIGKEPNQVHELSLQRLPGRLIVATVPTEGLSISIDGNPIGVTPLDPVELEPGEYEVAASAERYESARATVAIAGAGSPDVTLELTPRPLWAAITFDSTPSGAEVRVDGESVGRTPLTADLMQGRRGYEIRLGGYKPHRGSLSVVAGTDQSVPAPTLQQVDGWLVVTSDPVGATISIDAEYRGMTPLELEMAPGAEHTISASMSGYRSLAETVRIDSGKTHDVHLALQAELGEVSIVASPTDAELFVDGESRGAASQTIELPAVPHQIEVRKPGHVTISRQVTPRPGFPQRLEIALQTEAEAEEQAREAARTPVSQTPQGQELRLIEPGTFRMGASRREPGRRANETLRDVELTRAFYIATEEVSNKEFREFREGHKAGAAAGVSLDLDDYPVVEVSFEEAARYCNWLSNKQGLDPVYIEEGGSVVARNPIGNGYRLPTEAEWVWVARYEAGPDGRKYAWGNSLPVATGSGNYADSGAAGALPATISGYTDGHVATAPVDAFAPNALGIFNLGGNVAEWVHDYYSIYSSTATEVDKDPTGPSEGDYHVIKGASWMDSTITELRLSYRDYSNKARPDVGFRVARYAD